MPLSPEFRSLIETPSLAELGPGPRGGVLLQSVLDSKAVSLLDQARVQGVRRDLVRALLLLWHDHLDQAHSIVQGFETPDAAFIHGIVHRREPDYGNAGYWFRRVGSHRAFPDLANRAAEFLAANKHPSILTQLVRQGHWDPFGFIDACEAALHNSPAGGVLCQIQRIETEVLLNHLLCPGD